MEKGNNEKDHLNNKVIDWPWTVTAKIVRRICYSMLNVIESMFDAKPTCKTQEKQRPKSLWRALHIVFDNRHGDLNRILQNESISATALARALT